MKNTRFILIVGILFLSGSFYQLSAQQKTAALGAEVLTNVDKIAENAQEYVDKIDAVVDAVAENDLYKTVVDGFSGSFPYGIKPADGNANYALYINSITPDPALGMVAEVYMKIPIGSGKSLYFLADAVPISGGSLTGDARLFLLNTAELGLGKSYTLFFDGLQHGELDSTFVVFDCKGFKEISLKGRLKIDSTAIEKFSEDGKNTKEPLEMNFYINADKIENMIFEFGNVPTFQFASLPGFKCEIEKITLDNSELRNAPGFKLPDYYTEMEVPADGPNPYGPLWQGLYSPGIKFTIPKSFREGSEKSEEAIAINVEDFIIDQDGVTFKVDAYGSRTDEGESMDNAFISGNMKGFDYAIDTIGIALLRNVLQSAKFSGGIVLPLSEQKEAAGSTDRTEVGFYINASKSGDQMNYTGGATISGDEIVKASAFNADITLDEFSLEFDYRDKQFYPKAILTGDLIVGLKKKDAAADAEADDNIGFEFDGLIIDSESPYIDIANNGYFQMKTGGGGTLGKLPVSFEKVAIEKGEGGERTGLSATLYVSFQKSDGDDSKSSNGFGGECDFTVWAKRDVASQKWKYDGFDVNRIVVDVDQEAFSIYGEVAIFKGDSIYGDGFCGYLELEVIDKIKVEAGAYFGRVDGYRYWLVDASADIPGIPIGPGIMLNSFTGGLYHKMTMDLGNIAAESGSEGCKTASGRAYVPDENIFLGLLAGVGIQSTGGGNAFNGNINFGIEFNTNGGLNRICTWGGVKFVDFGFEVPDVASVAAKTMGSDAVSLDETNGEQPEVKPDAPDESASLWADWFVSYDFPNKTLQGDFNIYINAVDIIKGVGPGSRAGNISVYSSPDKWYVYAGKPLDPIGVDVINMIEITSYFCLGTELPTPPIAPMPSEVKGFDDGIDYSLLGTGSGFSFGARVSIDGSPGLPLGLCRAKAELRYGFGTGFDILLSQSNQPVYCSAKFPERGINDWYATGQAYIYGYAGLGVSYDCAVFGTGFLDVLELNINAGVQTQLPRPSYFKGAVNAEFSVLGSSFSKSFDVEVGQICEQEPNLSNNILLIESVTPANNSVDIDVNTHIEVKFAEALEDYEYTIEGNTFRKQLNAVYAYYNDGTVEPISISYDIIDDNKTLKIYPDNVLRSNESVMVVTSLVTQIKRDEEWEDLTQGEPENIFETDSTEFTTGLESNSIASTNVRHAYPLPGMMNFYKNESNKGHIQLASLPIRPVELPAGYIFSVAIMKGETEIIRVNDVTYDYAIGRFDFDIPINLLEPGIQYGLKLMKSVPEGHTQADSSEVPETLPDEILGETYSSNADIIILEYGFRTSVYNTFLDKMASLSTSLVQMFDDVIEVGLKANAESISEYETEGYEAEPKLIRFGRTADYDGAVYDNFDFELITEEDGSIIVTSNSLDELNKMLYDSNLKCLLNGNCDTEEVVIEAGKFMIPVGYFIPGTDTPSSVYGLTIIIENEIIYPR